jgi:alpha-tubulin suppressor-like RCC1 family protein
MKMPGVRDSIRPVKFLRSLLTILISLAILFSVAIPAFAASLVISTSSLDSGATGVAYSKTLEASGGTSPYTWSVSSGSLPDGLSLNTSGGVISGTPTTSGTSTFTIRVSDSAGTPATDDQTLSIVIYNAVSISTRALISGADDMEFSYSQTLTASGGSGSYTWTKTSGTLPTGLSLSSAGVLSGTPSKSGQFEIIVKAVDSNNSANYATQTLELVIWAPGYLTLWGDNSNGQIGNNSSTDVKSPTQPDDQNSDDIFYAAAGGLHSLAVNLDGEVYAWGDNSNGQLGIDSTTDKDTPEQVDDISDIVSVAAGYYHSLALDKDGNVYSWGDNSNGQLGIGSLTDKYVAQEVDDLSDIVAISTGYYHSLALKSDGTVWAWGDNAKGQLGINSTTDSTSPVQVKRGEADGDGTYLTDIVAIAAGAYFNLALDVEGNVWAWGDNSNGELGNDSTTTAKTPVAVEDIEDIYLISAGSYHSLAVDTNGDVYAWGDNSNGQLGIGTTTDKDTPQDVDDIYDIVSVAAGYYHSLAVDIDGNVYSWGDNSNGQMGIGSTTDKDTPEQIDAYDETATFVAAQLYNSLAISIDTPDTSDDDFYIETESLDDAVKNSSYSEKVYLYGGTSPYEWEITDDPDDMLDYLDLDYDEDDDYCTLSGKFTKTGTFDFTIEATDDDGNSASMDLSIYVDTSSSSSSSSTSYTLSTTGLTSSSTIYVDSNGYTNSSYLLTSTDGKLTISIPSDDLMQTSTNTRLTSITSVVLSAPPSAPTNNVVIQSYSLGPSGATFNPSLTLTFKYGSVNLPSGVAEDSLYIATYNGSSWERLSGSLNTSDNTISANISHFSYYALMGVMNTSTTTTTTTKPTSTSTPVTTQTTLPASTTTTKPVPVPTTTETVTSTTSQSTISTQAAATSEPTPAPGSSTNWPLIICVVIIVILAGVLIYVIITRSRNKPQ